MTTQSQKVCGGPFRKTVLFCAAAAPGCVVMADASAEPAPAAGDAEAAHEAAAEAEAEVDEEVRVEAEADEDVDSDEEADRLVANAMPVEEEEAEGEAEEEAAATTGARKEEVETAEKAADDPVATAAGSTEASQGGDAAASSVSDDASQVGHPCARLQVEMAAASAVPAEAKQRLAALEEESSWVDCSKKQAPVMAWSGKRDVFFKLADTIEEVRDDDQRGLTVHRDRIIKTTSACEHRVVCSIFIGEASEQVRLARACAACARPVARAACPLPFCHPRLTSEWWISGVPQGQRELQELLGVEQLPKREWLIIHSTPSEADALGLGMCQASQVRACWHLKPTGGGCEEIEGHRAEGCCCVVHPAGRECAARRGAGHRDLSHTTGCEGRRFRGKDRGCAQRGRASRV